MISHMTIPAIWRIILIRNFKIEPKQFLLWTESGVTALYVTRQTVRGEASLQP